MNQPLVSVIIPIYNVEIFLRECVDSVIRQTYENIEVILVDDGSPDKCPQICDEYAVKDSRVRVFHRKNGGLSAARNSGLEIAKGKYVYFLDSDDYIAVDCIEKLIHVAEKEHAECVLFDAAVVSEDSVLSVSMSYRRNKQYESGTGAFVAYRMLINDEYKPCVPLCFYSNNFLKKNYFTFKVGITGEDELFSFHIFMNSAKVCHLQQPLYYRRIRNGSIMTTTNKKRGIRFSHFCIVSEEIYKEGNNKNDGYQHCFFKEVIGRMLKSSVLIYREMTDSEKLEHKLKYREIKNLILKNRGFGDASLILRLYTYYPAVLVSGIRKKIRQYLYDR